MFVLKHLSVDSASLDQSPQTDGKRSFVITLWKHNSVDSASLCARTPRLFCWEMLVTHRITFSARQLMCWCGVRCCFDHLVNVYLNFTLFLFLKSLRNYLHMSYGVINQINSLNHHYHIKTASKMIPISHWNFVQHRCADQVWTTTLTVVTIFVMWWQLWKLWFFAHAHASFS